MAPFPAQRKRHAFPKIIDYIFFYIWTVKGSATYLATLLIRPRLIDDLEAIRGDTLKVERVMDVMILLKANST